MTYSKTHEVKGSIKTAIHTPKLIKILSKFDSTKNQDQKECNKLFQHKVQEIKYPHGTAQRAFADLRISLKTMICNKIEFNSLEFARKEHD